MPTSFRDSVVTSLSFCRLRSSRSIRRKLSPRALLNALGGTYDLDGHKVVVTASIGIAVAKSRIDPDQFLRNADMALYQAKSEGRGTWRWFEAKMEANAQARRNLELDLRKAMESEGIRTLLSTALQSENQTNPDLRGAAAVASPRTRNGFPGRVHSRCRRNGTHRRNRQSGLCTRPAWNAGDGRAIPRSRSTSPRSSSTVPMFLRLFERRSPPRIFRPTGSRLR